MVAVLTEVLYTILGILAVGGVASGLRSWLFQVRVGKHTQPCGPAVKCVGVVICVMSWPSCDACVTPISILASALHRGRRNASWRGCGRGCSRISWGKVTQHSMSPESAAKPPG